jgi:hypothetical protein
MIINDDQLLEKYGRPVQGDRISIARRRRTFFFAGTHQLQSLSIEKVSARQRRADAIYSAPPVHIIRFCQIIPKLYKVLLHHFHQQILFQIPWLNNLYYISDTKSNTF